MILKIQRPLESSFQNPPILIYNEDRSIEAHFAFTEDLRKTIGPRLKIYVEAELKDGELRLIREVDPQPW